MKSIFTFILVLSFSTIMGQNKPRVVEYFDKDWTTVKNIDNAVYYRTVEDQNGQFLVKDHYRSNGSVQMEALCSSYSPTLIQNGKATWYYENGSIERTGMYAKGKPTGLIKSFYKNGAPRSEKVYVGEKVLIQQYWSVDGNPLLTNGSGFIAETDEVSNIPTFTEVKDSVQIYTYLIETANQDTIYSYCEQRPEFKGGIEAFYRGVGNSLVYPKYARRHGIQGKVFIEFAINKNGVMQDARVVKGIGGGCDEAALDACIRQGSWTPAVVHGKPVKVRFTLPVIFKLG